MQLLMILSAVLLAAGDVPRTEPEDAPTVGASLDRAEAHVGDRLTLTVTAVARPGIAVTLPSKLDLGKLEAEGSVERSVRDLGDGRRSHRFVLSLAAYEVGDLEVPPLELSWITPNGELHTVKTAPVPLKIKPLVSGDEPNQDVQPLRPPRSAIVEDKRLLKAVRWGLAVLGGLLAFASAFTLVRRLLRRRVVALAETAAEAGPRRPPDEVAMEKLRALRAAGQFARDGYRPLYFAVAEVVREYLGGRYGFDSLELTTTELLDALRVKAPHLADAGGEVARFLHDTDLVKFANAGSTDERALAILDAAQAIVLSTAAPLEEMVKASSGPHATEAGGG